MKNIIVVFILICTSLHSGKAQDKRTDLTAFIGHQLEECRGMSSKQAAKVLCNRVSKEYGLKKLDPEYVKFITSVLNKQNKQKGPARMNLVKNSLYRQAIASVFLVEDRKIVAKNLGCEAAKSTLNEALRDLPGAISSLMDCMQEFGWQDAIDVYNSVDVWTSSMIFLGRYYFDNENSEKPLHQYDLRHPDYAFTDCLEEIEHLRELNRRIAEVSEACK